MKRINVLLIVCLFTKLSFSISQVDTISVFSTKMKKQVKAVVVTPDNYNKKATYPVVYLLHGYSGNYSDWIKNVPVIKSLSSKYQLLIVCPDGAYNSWYFDSPVDSSSQYESYITKDLVSYIDTHFSTIPTKSARAITGLSMGGHGALYIAMRNSNIFASAGSMSGGVDLTTITNKYEITNKIGKYEQHPEEWRKRSVMNLVDSLKNKELDLIIDCGVADFFYQINSNLHQKLLGLKIDHDYIERPGAHTWEYWTNAIEYQLLYFEKCFSKLKK